VVRSRPVSNRTGVDLHPDQCRVVGVHVRARDGDSGDVRVKAFALLAEGRMSPTLASELACLRQEQQFSQDAWVTIWGLGPDHAEIARQIQPLVDAGFDVRGVCTPAMALTAAARHRERSTSGAIAAYVAIESSAICIAIVRDGVLLFAREIPSEFVESAEGVHESLVAELQKSLLIFRQSFRAVVERVVLCGGIPNLRALTSSTSAALSVPVETLDSLSGIVADDVPEPADTFRATVAALWPAIAIASEGNQQPTLLPVPTRVQRGRLKEVARIAAAMVAGALALAAWYFITGSAPESAPPAPAAVSVARPSVPPPSDDIPKPRATQATAEPNMVVGSILFSQQRRLAIVNGRIVRIGDRIGSSTVLDIERRTVIVQSDDGTRRTLELLRP
jgi:hypothetical protein